MNPTSFFDTSTEDNTSEEKNIQKANKKDNLEVSQTVNNNFELYDSQKRRKSFNSLENRTNIVDDDELDLVIERSSLEFFSEIGNVNTVIEENKVEDLKNNMKTDAKDVCIDFNNKDTKTIDNYCSDKNEIENNKFTRIVEEEKYKNNQNDKDINIRENENIDTEKTKEFIDLEEEQRKTLESLFEDEINLSADMLQSKKEVTQNDNHLRTIDESFEGNVNIINTISHINFEDTNPNQKMSATIKDVEIQESKQAVIDPLKQDSDKAQNNDDTNLQNTNPSFDISKEQQIATKNDVFDKEDICCKEDNKKRRKKTENESFFKIVEEEVNYEQMELEKSMSVENGYKISLNISEEIYKTDNINTNLINAIENVNINETKQEKELPKKIQNNCKIENFMSKLTINKNKVKVKSEKEYKIVENKSEHEINVKEKIEINKSNDDNIDTNNINESNIKKNRRYIKNQEKDEKIIEKKSTEEDAKRTKNKSLKKPDFNHKEGNMYYDVSRTLKLGKEFVTKVPKPKKLNFKIVKEDDPVICTIKNKSLVKSNIEIERTTFFKKLLLIKEDLERRIKEYIKIEKSEVLNYYDELYIEMNNILVLTDVEEVKNYCNRMVKGLRNEVQKIIDYLTNLEEKN